MVDLTYMFQSILDVTKKMEPGEMEVFCNGLYEITVTYHTPDSELLPEVDEDGIRLDSYTDQDPTPIDQEM